MQKETLEGYGLSPQQKRLCLAQQGDDNPPYRAQCVVLIEGQLISEQLEAVLEDVISRHEILRTTFQRLPGLNIPVQVINDERARWLGRYDLSEMSEHQQLAELDRFFQEAKQVAFDFERGPLLHLSLFKLSSDKNVLMLGLPAICSDRAGLKNLALEISRCYASRLTGEPLDEAQSQYADVSAYLAELLESEETEVGRRYWRNFKFSDYPELRFLFERQSGDGKKFAPEYLKWPINPDLGQKIEVAVKKYNTTASALLLAIWQTLLWRLTGQSTVLIGAAFPGREVAGLEELPGLFERYLPFESTLDSQLRFSELLVQLSEPSAQLAAWQDYFQWSSSSTSSGESKELHFFPVCFEFDDGPTSFPAGGVTISLLKQYCCIERFKIKLSCVLDKDSLIAEFHYDSHLFDAEDVKCMAEQFHTLLGNALDNLESPLGRLGLLSDTVRQRLLFDFNRTKVNHLDDNLLHQQIEAQAERTPHRTAVVYGQERLSYAELNGRANQLAHHLRRFGVGPDVPVMVCLERSLELIIGILGILKAGGAYVPLDPAYPAQRLAFIMEQTQSPVLLTQARLRDRLAVKSAQVLYLDTEWPAIAVEQADNVPSYVVDENLAYVIYTSGSTGQPKGVMIQHRGLRNYLNWASQTYRVGEGKGAPVHSSIGFDLTVTSLFSPLIVGEKVVLLERDEGPEALAEALRQNEEFSLVKITPPHLNILSELMKKDDVERVTNAFIIGGEALFAENLTFWRTSVPRTRIINEYGPTETVVGCCVFEVSDGDSLRGAVPIGKPIDNTQIFILDERLEPVPPNVLGEIYIGGAGLARGYLKRPDLTAERFIPHPFSTEPGALLYKTGDLGRHCADGNVEYWGRLDQQVKIRGYRIELGEIEAALTEHPRVSEAVIVVNDSLGEKRLVSYVVADGQDEFDTTRMRAYLKERLPDYMIPAVLVRLDKLPLTSNGKVDRRALPAPDTVNSGLEKSYAAPRNEVEEVLAGLWAKAVGMERVGINDDFFALGGDSILSIQLANRANNLGISFTPRQVFEHRTISALASALGPSEALKAEQGIITGAIHLTPIQHWFFEQNVTDAHHWNQAIMLETRERLNADILEKALQILLVHHDALRLRFIRDESGWQQFGTQPDGEKLLEEFDLSTSKEVERSLELKKISSELQASLNLMEGRLVRAALIDVDRRKANLLLIVIHHLAVDIVSWSILLEGIETAYRQISTQQPPQLPAKSSSFKDWAERLTQYARTPKLRRELAFWAHESRRRASHVPLDFPGGENTEASARKFSVSLGRTETKDLLQEVPKVAGTMINDLLLTALALAFSRWTHSRSLLVDLENHGREEIFDDIDLSRTVGWFTCIFPLLLDLEGAHGPGEALKAVRGQIRRVPQGGIGYGLLRYLSQDREIHAQLKALSRADISFNYVGRFSQSYSESSLFAAVRDVPAPSHSPRGMRPYVIELNGGIDIQGQLQMTFTYSENLHRRSTIEGFGEGFIRALMDIIEQTLLSNAAGHTPSGFLVGDMSQRELDRLMAELSEFEE